MPAARVCNGCGRRFKPTGGESRCAECGRERSPAAVTAQRREYEPWRALYKQSAWHAARERALVRDGRRCRGAYGEVRCRRTAELQVHHRRKLRDLWADSDSFADFVTLACNLSWLVTLCPRCHALAERPADRGQDGSRSSG